MPTIELNTSDATIKRIEKKVRIASLARTKEWDEVPTELRDRALFSAGVDNVTTLNSIGDKLTEWSDFVNKDSDRALMNKGKFISEMRQELGAAEGDTGDIRDLTSQRRLALIWDFQTQDASEYGRWKMDQDPDILDAFPAQEFVRVASRMVPREDWEDRWIEAGGELFDGRMIALKNDPVWTNLSRFDRPFPTFDFNSGMGLQDIERSEAEELGLIEPGETVESKDIGFNDNVEASVRGVLPNLIQKLTDWFGDAIKIDGDKASWAGA